MSIPRHECEHPGSEVFAYLIEEPKTDRKGWVIRGDGYFIAREMRVYACGRCGEYLSEEVIQEWKVKSREKVAA